MDGGMTINAEKMHFQALNDMVRDTTDEAIVIENCMGQRYIGDGVKGKQIVINGTPGNALGAYLDGGEIVVNGNAQDATGDTMNDGAIYIHGSAGDAAGYAMRGGKIMIHGDIGYRAGIHMKAYQDKSPLLMVGGTAGSFLGEYQAGGTIIVLGLHSDGKCPVGYFCGTGMHGGRMFLRTKELPQSLPPQVMVRRAEKEDIAEILTSLKEFCDVFSENLEEVLSGEFFLLEPDTKNPYHRLYTQN